MERKLWRPWPGGETPKELFKAFEGQKHCGNCFWGVTRLQENQKRYVGGCKYKPETVMKLNGKVLIKFTCSDKEVWLPRDVVSP